MNFMYYFTLFMCSFFGFLFHSCLKYKSLRDQAIAAKLTFTFKNYLSTDAASIIASFASIFIWLFCFGEIVAKYPALAGFTKVSFVIMGAMGSYLVQLAFSTAQKRITNVISDSTAKTEDSVKTV